MKKLITLLTVGMMTMSMIGCGAQNQVQIDDASTQVETEEVTVGGWQTHQTIDVPQEAQDALNKALEDLTGATYEPVTLLATQVVAGTNYAILCKVTPVYPDAEGSYAIVYVYQSLDGEAELVNVEDLIETNEESVEGGWNNIVTEETSQVALDAFTKAVDGMVGANYEVAAVVGTQVVAGMNYMYVCNVTTVTPDAEGKYALVTVYEDLDGNAEITEVVDLTYSLQ